MKKRQMTIFIPEELYQRMQRIPVRYWGNIAAEAFAHYCMKYEAKPLLERLSNLVTTEHESKEDFINRVRLTLEEYK